jgi:hypothetical protein
VRAYQSIADEFQKGRFIVQVPYESHSKRWLGENVQIVYLDDSKQDKIKNRFQLIGAVIVNDVVFTELEQQLAYYLYQLAQPDATDTIKEFHATHILSGKEPFENITKPRALEILGTAVQAVIKLRIPVIYGAVDLNKLFATDYATANPVDIAFRRCARLVEQWFVDNSPDGLGLMICDDGDKHVKNAMLNAFRLFRKQPYGSPAVRGDLEHLHDDMYFGDSQFSKGIQLADICTFIIGRHLVGYLDTEDLYQQLSESIVKSSSVTVSEDDETTI